MEFEDEEKEAGEFKLTGRLKWMKVEALIKLMPHLEPYLRKKKAAEKIRIQGPGKKIIGKLEKKLEQDREGRRTAATSSAWMIDKNVTSEMLDKKLKEIIGSRGRKGTNAKETVRALEVLAKAARLHGPSKEIPVLMYLIASLFDSHKSIDEYMELQDWRTGYRHMNRIFLLLQINNSLVLGALDEEDISFDLTKKPSDESKEDAKSSDSNVIRIVGSLETFLARLEEEYTKSLQQISPHTQVSYQFFFTNYVS